MAELAMQEAIDDYNEFCMVISAGFDVLGHPLSQKFTAHGKATLHNMIAGLKARARAGDRTTIWLLIICFLTWPISIAFEFVWQLVQQKAVQKPYV